MLKKRKPRDYWTVDRLKEEASKYTNISEFKKNNKDAYNASHRKKIIQTVCAHMPIYKRSVFTKEYVKNISIQYNNRISLKKADESVYHAALSFKDPEYFFGHMEPSKGEAYSFEELLEIARKYKTRGDFKKNNPTAHRAACRRSDYSDMCYHMELIGGTSWGERYVYDAVKNIYNSAKKLVDRSVKILNKPHIKGFDIDIYIPELHKGIEFDGEYTHSFNGLRRNREHWPQEDIDNYHTLKDKWFFDKGIEILHIKQEDFESNIELSIKKCLEFLGVKCP